MYRKVKKIITCAIAAVAFTTTLFANPPTTVKAAEDLVYDEGSGYLNGAMTTTGEVNRIEIFYSDSCDLTYSWLTNSTQETNKISLDEIVKNGITLSTEVEIVGGGTTTVPNYPLKCSSFYITSTSQNAEQWNFMIEFNELLSECFIVQAEVPSNWINNKNSITKPLEFSLGYLTASSSFTTDDIIPIISTLSSGTADNSEAFKEVEPVEEEEKDPLVAILKLMIAVVFIAIVVTAILYQKTKKANAKKESEEYVKRANDKVKAKKSRENDDLIEIMESYSKFYQDDDLEEDEEEDEEEYDIMSDDDYRDIPVYQEDAYSSSSYKNVEEILEEEDNEFYESEQYSYDFDDYDETPIYEEHETPIVQQKLSKSKVEKQKIASQPQPKAKAKERKEEKNIVSSQTKTQKRETQKAAYKEPVKKEKPSFVNSVGQNAVKPKANNKIPAFARKSMES